SRTMISIHLFPSLRTSAPAAGPALYFSRSLILLASFLSSSFVRCWIDAIEVPFERIEVLGPQAAEGSQPRIHLHERLGPEPVHAPLRVRARLHESSLAEHPQVLRERGLRHLQLPFDLADGSLRGRQQGENGPAIRLSDDGKGRLHMMYIPIRAYTCQGIYSCPSPR